MNIIDIGLLIDEFEIAVHTLELLYASSDQNGIPYNVANKLHKLHKKYPSEMSIDIDNMSLKDIIESLKCKCKDLQDRKGKHGDVGDGFGKGKGGRYGGKYDPRRGRYGDSELFGEFGEYEDYDEMMRSKYGTGFGSALDGYQGGAYGMFGYGMFDNENLGSGMLGAGMLGNGISESDMKLNDNNYLTVKEYAIQYTNDLLEKAVSNIGFFESDIPFKDAVPERKSSTYIIVKEEAKNAAEVELETENEDEQSSSSQSTIDYENTNLTIGNFTIESGKAYIKTTVDSWILKKKWLYCINFITKLSDTCVDSYVYEVKWSIPTNQYPIPQVTVITRFTIEVSRVKLPFYPIKVYFVFEGERHKFTLKDEIQHEKFLDTVINCKTRFFKTLHYTPEQKTLYDQNYFI